MGSLGSVRALERASNDRIGAGKLVSDMLGALLAENRGMDEMERDEGIPIPNASREARVTGPLPWL